MSISVVVIGVNEWERFTKPLLDDLEKYLPEANIFCVDNGSNPPYPPKNSGRIDYTVSYAEALNYGLQVSKSDWYVLTNNDVRVRKPFGKRLEALDPNNLYGFYLWEDVGAKYLSGWCYFLSRKIFNKVGYFDELFTPMWFEDADYSIRSVKAGFGLGLLDRDDWGIVHLAENRTDERMEYMKKNTVARQRNLEYLQQKHGLK